MRRTGGVFLPVDEQKLPLLLLPPTLLLPLEELARVEHFSVFEVLANCADATRWKSEGIQLLHEGQTIRRVGGCLRVDRDDRSFWSFLSTFPGLKVRQSSRHPGVGEDSHLDRYCAENLDYIVCVSFREVWRRRKTYFRSIDIGKILPMTVLENSSSSSASYS